MKAYAIKNPQGTIYLGTIQEDEKDCIDEYFDRYKIGTEERNRRWNERQKEGYACVEVSVVEKV
jgi:hypothetical protein